MDLTLLTMEFRRLLGLLLMVRGSCCSSREPVSVRSSSLTSSSVGINRYIRNDGRGVMEGGMKMTDV